MQIIRRALLALRRNVGTGLLVFAPVALSAWLVYVLYVWVSTPLGGLFELPPPEAKGIIPAIARFFNDALGETLCEVLARPGIALVLAILVLYVTGLLARTFLGRLFISLTDAVIERLPIVRTVYIGIKQILGAMLSGSERHFRDVVLFEYPRKGIYSIGFVTGTTRGSIREKAGADTANVFLPTTPNPTSGFLLLVPKDQLTYLSMSVEDAVKLVISGGIVSPADFATPPPHPATAPAEAAPGHGRDRGET